MEQLTANLTGKVRRETLDGREYLVAPVAMIVAGRVLNGSQGSLYYPENEVAANPGMWNGVPITVGHPHLNGENTSARQPSVMNTFAIGTVYNDRFENGKRLAEGWFDVAATRKKAPDVYAALNAGRPMELSTGLFTDNVPATNGKSPSGQSYDYVAKNYKPDHLAILPHQRGACSLKDGCGLLVGNECKGEFMTTNDEKKSLWRKLGEMIGVLNAGTECDCGGTCDECKGKTDAVKNKKSPTKNQETDMSRTDTIQYLTTNCDCWKGKAAVLANEDAFTDADLTKLAAGVKTATQNALVANAVADSFGDEFTSLTANAMPQFIKDKIAAKEGDEEEEDDEEEETPVIPVKNKKPTKNAMTKDEFEAVVNANPELSAVWNTAKRIEQTEKRRLITRLTANCADAAKKAAMVKRFSSPSVTINELEDLVSLLPPAPVARKTNAAMAPMSYFGSQPLAPVANADEDASDDLLDVPVLNFAKK